MELFDQRGHLSWRSPREFSPRFACDSILSSFLNSSGHTFNLRRGDKSNLAYLACTSPSWLLVPSMSGPSTLIILRIGCLGSSASIRISRRCLKRWCLLSHLWIHSSGFKPFLIGHKRAPRLCQILNGQSLL